MKMSLEEAANKFGVDVIKELKKIPAEPTGRHIYPAFEPQHVGMAEYVAGDILVTGGKIRAYYFQPENANEDNWEYGEMNGIEYGDIDNIEYQEDFDEACNRYRQLLSDNEEKTWQERRDAINRFRGGFCPDIHENL